MTYGAGNVAGASGRATFAARLNTGPVDGWLDGRELHNPLGAEYHAVINDQPPFDAERNTTAEELARFVYEQVSERLPAGRVVRRVEVWETESSCAVYEQ